ncbi:MAG: type II toxin-antitoxin system RelE/ParE family toxin [Spartobacteria bacterium]|nr:type II toxin-antitoxin system RelE/ParE family toxin [Spartobacteria bacterium]
MEIRDVFLLEAAVADLESGRLFYEEQQPGLGGYFWDTLLSDMESLIIYGGIHVKEMGCYRMLSKRFPYAVYYEVKNNSAYVVAVLPMLRDPKWIRGKLEERS